MGWYTLKLAAEWLKGEWVYVDEPKNVANERGTNL